MSTHTTQSSFPVQGMTCASCVSHVEKALNKVPGVESAKVNLATESATVQYDPTQASVDTFAKAVQEEGYQVPLETEIFNVQGMTCASCVGRVEKALMKVSGVSSVAVNLASEKATVEHWPGVVSFDDLRQAVDEAGYTLSRTETITEDAAALEKHRELRSLWHRIIVSGLASVFVMLAPMNLIPGLHSLSDQVLFFLLFVVTTPVLFWAGRPIYSAAWNAALHKTVNMNTLIAIGTLAAYVYSVAATFIPSFFEQGGLKADVYYDTAIMIIALILLGRYLETGAKSRTSAAIKKLMGLRPSTARVRRNNEEQDIPIDLVVSGDIIVVRPGDRIPVDGVVLEGYSSIDEAMLTGESLPVDKEAGAKVYAGTINTTGSFTFTASAVGKGYRSCPNRPSGAGSSGLSSPDPTFCRQGGEHFCPDGDRNCYLGVCGLVIPRSLSGFHVRAPRLHRRPHYCLPVRVGFGDTHGCHGGNGPWCRTRHLDPQCRGAGNGSSH